MITILIFLCQRPKRASFISTQQHDWHKKLYPAFKKLFMAPNPVPVKAALAHKGIIEDVVRRPLVELSDDEKTELFKVLDSVKND